MINTLLLPELRELLENPDDPDLLEALTEMHPANLAEFSEGLSAEETWKLLELLPVQRRAEVFAFYPHHKQVELASGAGRERLSQLLEAMSHDDRVDLLKRLDEELVESLLPLVAKADREDIRRLMRYPEHTAGAVMTTDYATLPPDITVLDALALLRRQAPSTETIYYVYVVDDQRRLIGFVSLRDLVLARPNALVRDIMQEEVISVRVEQDQEEVARILSKYDFLAIPVVDAENRLVGIVTYDDVMDVLTEEATEDAQKFGAVTPIEDNYLEAAFVTVWRKRAMWLSALFVAELFTFTALARYEHAIESVLALSLFIPLCISTGGNSGSQAATLITRALALGQIRLTEWLRVLRHELLMGVALGATLGLIGFVRAYLTPESVLGGADKLLLALVIAQSVAAICLWGTLVGSMLPLLFKALGFDPGYASSPFVATFVDVTGIVIYFNIAYLYLPQLHALQ
ncbi:MAG: magnesium transporter MgtE [Pirellulaceae bacterium]|nr:MAG: magnesium transporter MgtE [Pirellulaceae bacterium]